MVKVTRGIIDNLFTKNDIFQVPENIPAAIERQLGSNDIGHIHEESNRLMEDSEPPQLKVTSTLILW